MIVRAGIVVTWVFLGLFSVVCWTYAAGAPIGAAESVSWYFGALAALCISVAMLLAARPRCAEGAFGGLDRMYRFHKYPGVASLVVVPVHLATGMEDDDDDAPALAAAVAAKSRVGDTGADTDEKEDDLDGLIGLMGMLCAVGFILLIVVTLNRKIPYHKWIVSHEFMGLFFTPGQFAFVEVDAPGFREAHPFSMSSGAWEGHLRFTVKALGDYTRRLRDHVHLLGATVRVEGPYGRFDPLGGLDRQVWIAGGIGITPFLSVMRSLDPEHGKTIRLHYCLREGNEAVFWGELTQRAILGGVSLQHKLRHPEPGEGQTPAMTCRALPGVRTAIAAAAVLVLSGCASTATLSGDPDDPWEPANRTSYALNDAIDRAVLKPGAHLYLRLPRGLRASVNNFFDNAAYPGTVLNQALQGKLEPAMRGSARFVFNTTLGIGGLFDVATGFGLEREEEDFGQTLAVWGMEAGNHIHWPVLGPSSVRDTPGSVVGALTDVLTYAGVFPLALLELLDTRANLASAVRIRDETAFDPYVFTREAYRQRRTFLIHDGNPPFPAPGEDADDG